MLPRFFKGDLVVVESPVVYSRTAAQIAYGQAGEYLALNPDLIDDGLGVEGIVWDDKSTDGNVLVRFGADLALWVFAGGLVHADPPPHVDPLEAPLESTRRHDPYINKRFLALMGQPEMTEEPFTDTLAQGFAAAVNVGLAANDPERPERSVSAEWLKKYGERS